VSNTAARPYCAVNLYGSDAKGQEMRASGLASYKRREGNHQWSDHEEAIQFHCTGYHTHMTLEAIDSYQFGDRSVSLTLN
jgi:hypothetical protein